MTKKRFPQYNPNFPGINRTPSTYGKLCIYILVGTDNTVRYVGKTCFPRLREKYH